MKIIDSHFHAQILVEKGLDAEKAMSFLSGGIDIGCSADDIIERSKITKNFPHIKRAAAMGPWEVENRSMEELERQLTILFSNVEKYNVKFIGEAGLDNYWKYGTVESQEFLFIRQMQYAEKSGRRIIIHNREADKRTEEIIREYGPSKGGIIHCFSGSLDVMRAALDRGYYISYAGNLTYKANQSLRDTLKYVPEDRLLLETDAPYLAPVPMRGKANTPLYVVHTYSCAAEVLNLKVEELSERVYSNFLSVCG
ncbi:MAG: TatD family hydrolase [Sphaerochaetaceae bacterium]|nr:TatD family hydrolase [Sphaerochaetaceae bacterium]